MPDISAFRGIRYDLGRVGSLSDVVAPPYDVIDTELQHALYDRHPANVVRLILNRDLPGDDEHANRYSRAARLLRSWLREGVLFTESDPAIYVYDQEFEYSGTRHTRRGFMCRVRLETFGQGHIYPHEETHSRAKADRLRLLSACKANLSPVFGLYPDPQNEAQNILERTVAGTPPLEATDHLGVVHRMWPVTDVALITEVIGAMGGRPVYIADGHHRYETACALRDQLAVVAAGGSPASATTGGPPVATLPPEHPANFVLMACVSMSDPGLLVLPTHRLFRGLPPITSRELADRLGNAFTTEPAGSGPEQARSLWEEIEIEGEQATLGLYTAADDQWTIARLTHAGRDLMAQVAADQSPEWRGLGVSILHRLVINTLLGGGQAVVAGLPTEPPVRGQETRAQQWGHGNLPAPKYVHDVEEVVHGLIDGDDSGRDATGQIGTDGRFELAALVMPATVEHVAAISTHGERMPAKSTFFYPKLLSGLVINPLE
jgi:uncharacterized protein (DUF1015 family)